MTAKITIIMIIINISFIVIMKYRYRKIRAKSADVVSVYDQDVVHAIPDLVPNKER